MFVPAKQAPVDAQLGVCVVQEFTNLYLQPIRKVGGPGTVCARGGWTATQDTPARSVGAVLSPRSPLRSHHDHFSDRLLVLPGGVPGCRIQR